MSAYNVYNKPVVQQQKSDILLDKYLDLQRLSHGSTQENYDLFTKKQHLSSNGSSINVSPTSQSSLESSNNIDRTKQSNEPMPPPPQVHQVKPPETPRTKSAATSYRKNLLLNLGHRQHSEEQQLGIHTKTDDLREFLEKKNQRSSEDFNEKNVAQTKQKPPVAAVNKLDHFFASTSSGKKKPSVGLKRKPNKNSVFNIMDDMGDDGEYSDDEELNDTFDIFSSRESLAEERTEKVEKVFGQFKKSDLKIDLNDLSADEDTKVERKKDKNGLSSENEVDDDGFSSFKAQNFGMQLKVRQVRPEIIPMLDLMDDEKSQSVAASLAVSMCKEIDYQKEMQVRRAVKSGFL
jgi:hypothetical protein